MNPSELVGAENHDDACWVFTWDINWLFEGIFFKLTTHQTGRVILLDFIWKFKVPELLFSLIASDMTLVSEIFNFVEEIDYIDTDMLDTFIKLASPNGIIPNLDTLFEMGQTVNPKKFKTSFTVRL